MRIALHTCCGPCLIEPYDHLAAGCTVTIVFSNPNIHPAEEYRLRRDAAAAYAAEIGAEFVELDYAPAAWDAAVADAGTREQRCRACYRLRLAGVARYAAEHGLDAIATTLTVSPYQDSSAITDEGRIAAGLAGVTYVETDFRPRYREATRRSREMGMYRQNYCGCTPSKAEVEAERAARREARRSTQG